MNDPALEAAIEAFPVIGWVSNHTKVYDTGGDSIYADCPICGGRRKLGIVRQEHFNKGRTLRKGTFHCFKCDEGGHGEGIWNGKAALPRMIKILEGCSWRDAFQLIYRLAGLPEPPRAQKKEQKRELPHGCVPLANCSPSEPAVKMLTDRRLSHLVISSYLCMEAPYNERLIVPLFFKEVFLGFEARAVYPSQKPKVLYPEWLDAGSSLYTAQGWVSSPRLVVTESTFDAETFSGVENAVGCFGGFKEPQLQRFLELEVEQLVWAMDGDAWKKQAEAIAYCAPFFRQFVVEIPNDQDPNSMGREACRESLANAVEVKSTWTLMECAQKWGKPLS